MDRVVVTTGGAGVLALLPALLAIMFQIGAVYEHREQTKKNRGLDRYKNL